MALLLSSSLFALLLSSVSANSLEARAQQCTGTPRNPPPSTYVCGQHGSIQNPSIIQNATAQTIEACENLCFNDQPRCISFSYGPKTACTTYNKNILGSMFKRNKTAPVVWYNRKCFNINCVCTGGQNLCGSQCVDFGSDPANCGSCGNACPEGDACSNGTCLDGCNNECPSGTTCQGDGVCADPCGNSCPQGSTCGRDGTCTDSCDGNCPNGSTCQDGSCVDACHNECPQGSTCGGDGTCIDSCGNNCIEGSNCVDGTCVDQCGNSCPTGTQCGTDGTCIDSCNNSCPDGSTCSNGVCQCTPACGSGQTCQNGACTCSAPQTITDPNDCYGPGFQQVGTGTGKHRNLGDGQGYLAQTAYPGPTQNQPCTPVNQCAQYAIQLGAEEFETYFNTRQGQWLCNIFTNTTAAELANGSGGPGIPTISDGDIGSWFDYADTATIGNFPSLVDDLASFYQQLLQELSQFQDQLDGLFGQLCQQYGFCNVTAPNIADSLPNFTTFIPKYC